LFNNVKIGIGITTTQRKENLEVLINSIKEYTNGMIYDICVAVDPTDDNTIEYLIQNEIEFISGKQLGPCLNKNRLLKKFSNYNYIVILEDDVLITREGWIDVLLLASTISGLPFFCYPSNVIDSYSLNSSLDIGLCATLDTKVLFYQRKVLEKVGGIDNNYTKYGVGIIEQYQRIVKSGLLNYKLLKKFPSVAQLNQYIQSQKTKVKLISDSDKLIQLQESARIKPSDAIYRFL
jgi:GT2 family glycosyltransferase